MIGTSGFHRIGFLSAFVFALLGLCLPAPAQEACAEDASAGARPEAAFCELEPIAFSFQNEGPTLAYVSSKARVFYTFHPAEEKPSKKPLFVFFNGGPGCATCDMLFSLNTAPFTLDPQRTGPRPIRKDPTSWTKIGNLLYVDAPETGFSYNLMDDPADPAKRAAEFGAQNFNAFIDAAQMVRLVLRFLGAHPALRANPVVLVGESYAGTRDTIMLHMLLYYGRYADGSLVYEDRKLAEEIGEHLDAVFPDHPGCPHPPEEVALQFGRQVMIQPLIAGSYQPEASAAMYQHEGSVIYEIAAETGTVYEPCPAGASDCDPWGNAIRFVGETASRDVYKYDEAAGWSDGIERFTDDGLSHVGTLSKALERGAGSVSGLPAAQRGGAYRFSGEGPKDLQSLAGDSLFSRLPPYVRAMLRERLAARQAARPEGAAGAGGPTLEQAFGAVHPWDAYLVPCSDDVTEAFYENSATRAGYLIDPLSTRFGSMFLEVLPLVDTLLTEDPFDLMVYPPAVPPSFERYAQYVRRVSVQRPCASCDGFIAIDYQPNSLPYGPTPQTRSIYFPHYASAGHPVTATMPEKFLRDVAAWMSWGEH